MQLTELRKLLLEPLDAMLHFDPTPSVEAYGDVQKLAVLLSDPAWPAPFIGNLHKVLFQLEPCLATTCDVDIAGAVRTLRKFDAFTSKEELIFREAANDLAIYPGRPQPCTCTDEIHTPHRCNTEATVSPDFSAGSHAG